MLLAEVLSLETWFNEQEEKNMFLKNLNSLLQVLAANVQAQKNRNANHQSFTKQKNDSIESLMKIDLSMLSDAQIKFLDVYGALEYVDRKSGPKLKQVFTEETHDIAYLLTFVTKYTQAISTFKSQITALSNGLDLFKKELGSFENVQKPRFSIVFRSNTSISNLGDLESASKNWRKTIHGLSKGLDLNEDDFEIIGTRNGSIVIDLYVAAAAIVPIGFILNRSFDIIERFALMTKRVNTVFSSDPNDEAFRAVEDEIKQANEKYFRLTKKLSSKKIASEVLEDEPEGTDKNERLTFIDGSIKKILTHLKNGGDLDMYIPDQIEESEEGIIQDEDLETARESIQSFREKKEKIGTGELIEFLKQIDFDDSDEQED
tara:strand:- start:17000 stop:18124 length:1125 start_codon:yes stop_codon:yes gene_type:complete